MRAPAQVSGGSLADLVAALPPVVSIQGLYVYGLGGVCLLVAAAKLRPWYRERTSEDVSLADLLDDATMERGAAEREALVDLAARHQQAMAPAAVEWATRAARVGDQWTATLYLAEYPDYPSDGYLSALFELPDVEFDLTAHVTPKQQARARSELQRTADDLRADANLERTVHSEYLKERAAEATATYKAVEHGQRVFSQGVFVTVRGDSREALESALDRVRATLREAPANCDPKPATCVQDQALRAAAPFGGNPLGREAVALGDAVGALLASPHAPTVLEPGGVEVGVHKDTRSPMVIDPFAREDGYAMFTVGDPGSGKSFGAKQQFLRSLAQDPDRIGVVLEPLNDWTGVAEALGAQRITVGGTLGLNPLEVKPTPEHVLAERGADASPLKEKRERVISFFTNFFAHRGVELGDRRTTLELAVDEAYAQAGITDDVSTHDRASPTIGEVLDILETLHDTPDEFVVRTDAEREKLQDDAVWLLDQLRPFDDGGQFANLGRASEFDLRESSVVYLDLVQQGGSPGGHTSLLMELLVSLVYERAKETDREVVFVIDEARYLMKDAATLQYLETIFRHHRHHDLSIRLVTQTVDEFFQHDVAEMILDQCAVKQFHKLDGMDEQWADEFGLNHPQMRFVQDATPGSEAHGYSQALLGVDGEWHGIEVRALERERAVIEGKADFGSSTAEAGATAADETDEAQQAVDSTTEEQALEADDD